MLMFQVRPPIPFAGETVLAVETPEFHVQVLQSEVLGHEGPFRALIATLSANISTLGALYNVCVDIDIWKRGKRKMLKSESDLNS